MPVIELPALFVDNVTLATPVGRLLLINRDPGPAEDRVPLHTTITLEIVDAGTDGIDLAATRVWVNEVVAFDGAATPQIFPAFAGPLAGATASTDTLRIVLHPMVPFPSLTSVTVRVSSRTNAAAAALDESYSFAIEDRVAPRVLAAQATGPKEVRVAFDEPVVASDGAVFAFAPKAAPAVGLVARTVAVEDRVMRITLDVEMTPDVTYEVRASGITDRFGNIIIPPFDHTLFVGFRPARPPSRRFDLWQMIPLHNRRGDETGDLFRFIGCLQEIVDLLLADIDRFVDIFDIERAPSAFLDLILRDLGNPFAFDLDVMGRRRLASLLVEMYRQRGTAVGLRNAIRFFLRIEVSVVAFTVDTLVLGESELGVDWVLGPSTQFSLYAFNLEVARTLSPTERRYVRQIVEYLRPVHTHFVDLIEPTAPTVPNHWEVGLSDVGETTILH